MKILHTSDWHLSTKFDNLPPEIALRRKEEQRQTISRILNMAANPESKIDVVLIAGDIFDSLVPDYADIQFVKQEFSKLSAAGIKTFIIPGNHDAYEPGGIWDREQFTAHIFKGVGLQQVSDPELKLDIFGYVYTRENKSHRAMRDCSQPTVTPGHSAVLLYHGSYENFGRELGVDYPFSEAEIKEAPFAYIALGHYHEQTEVLPGKAYYSGSPEAFKFDKNELGPRYFIIVKLGTDGSVEVAPVNTKAKEYLQEAVDLTTETAASITSRITTIASEKMPYLRLVFSGTPSPEILEFLPSVPNTLGKLFSYIEIQDNALVLPQNITFAENSYMKLYVQKVQQKIEQAANEDQKKLASKALELALAAYYERAK